MIIEYHRPESLEDALALLQRAEPRTLPLGGGTVLSRQRKPDVAVVDLQKLGLDRIESEGHLLKVGAAARLQRLFEYPDLPEALRESLLREAQLNLRQMATLGGTLASCDGRSPFVTALLALDPRLVFADRDEAVALGDYLALREAFEPNRLIVEVQIPVNLDLRFEMVARTPLDRPLVCAAVGRWPSGRTRVALGGYGKTPILAMDGPEPAGGAAAAHEAFRGAGDAWASSAYRMDVAARLVKRLLQDDRRESA